MTSTSQYVKQVDIIDHYVKEYANKDLADTFKEMLNIIYKNKNPLSHQEIVKLLIKEYGINTNEDANKSCFCREKKKIIEAIKNDPRWGLTINDITIKNIRRKLEGYILNPRNSELLGLALQIIEKQVDYIQQVENKYYNSIENSDREGLKRIQNKIGIILEKK